MKFFPIEQNGGRPTGLWAVRSSLPHEDGGSSLIEVALFAPILVLLVCYAVNYGYYFIVAINMTAATRSAAEYSIQGFAGPGASAMPVPGPATTTGSVASLAMDDMSNLWKSSTTSSVEICSAAGNTIGTNTVVCKSYGASTLSYAADTDPNPSLFQCNRVDVVYTVNPLIPITFFKVSWTPPATFHRMVEMRAIN